MVKATMRSMPISKFKATCLAVLEQVRRTGHPLRITRFGRPVADIVPPAPDAERGAWLGSMRGSLRIRGDIVGPTANLADWEASR
jgi:prevent-host-death family protein